MLEGILSILYPVRCPICNEIVVPQKNRICNPCKEKLNYIKEPRCKKCSKPMEDEEQEYCMDCQKSKHHYNKGYSVWLYDQHMKKSISNFKYHNKWEYAKFYIIEMVQHYEDTIKKLSIDVIIPVPLHPSKRLERGYNQAEILANGLGKSLNIPVATNLLIRSKKTLPQKQLSNKERLKNLKEAFRININALYKYDRKIERVLLMDDIYTTGSTIEACTNVLMEHGVSEVFFITLCIGKGY